MVLIDHQVSPSIASGAGGQTLSVTGANFLPDAPQLTCRFGALATAPARFVTPSLVLCAAPAHADGAVALAVANNGADFRAPPLEFVFAPVPVVDAVSPLYANPPLRSSPPPAAASPLPPCRPRAVHRTPARACRTAPTGGGVLVHVTGAHFHRGVSCDFGGVHAAADVRSPRELTCVAPPHHIGAAAFRIVHNALEFSAEVLPPFPSPRSNWKRLVLPPVLSGHVSSFPSPARFS
jgi:hypothetical protein